MGKILHSMRGIIAEYAQGIAKINFLCMINLASSIEAERRSGS